MAGLGRAVERRPDGAKKKSSGLTKVKKRSASVISEATMPTVVRMATAEQRSSRRLTTPSTSLRARSRAWMRARATNRPPRPEHRGEDQHAGEGEELERAQRIAGALFEGCSSPTTP